MKIMINIILLFALFVSIASAEDEETNCITVPYNLYKLMEENGYSQIDNFYLGSGGTLWSTDPPFVWGVDTSLHKMQSVAFWAKSKSEEDGYHVLLIAKSKLPYHTLKIVDTISTSYCGGLSLVTDTNYALADFSEFDKPLTDSGFTNGVVIKSEAESYTMYYYKHNERWVIKIESDIY
ncbi:MAG: hypothetical protein DWP97_05440 [Calditrichaeota bacterium]|nr:MAG: hypothetical protein DWP97_05440 [Calditrichota bacterium]